LLSVDREGWPSSEGLTEMGRGHTEMGRDQTADHSPDGRIVRLGPATRAVPDVMAKASQP